MKASGLAQLVRRRGAEAGLTIHPHMFRHTMAHNFLADGGTEGDLMSLAGWRSPEMLRVYGRSGAAQRAREAGFKNQPRHSTSPPPDSGLARSMFHDRPDAPRRYHPRSMDKSELIRTMREAHQRMAGAIEHLPDERLLEPAMDNWTGKDLIAHMAWWHDHSVLVIECLRAGRQPYDETDSANTTDAANERTHREHLDDPPELTRRAFNESFIRLLAALEPCTVEELFAVDRWPWLGGEALVETILWDSSRHYDAHREHLERLSR